MIKKKTSHCPVEEIGWKEKRKHLIKYIKMQITYIHMRRKLRASAIPFSPACIFIFRLSLVASASIGENEAFLHAEGI